MNSVPTSSHNRGDLRIKFGHIPALLLLTTLAFAVQGYHPGVEDAEIYNPAILKILNPSLYPFGAEFFQSHARLTMYPNLIATTARVFHSSAGPALIFWQLLSIFLLLLACWTLACELFENPSARWAGLGLVAALLTIPIAGTGLYLMDEYVNPRAIALFLAIFMIADTLKKKYAGVALWALLSAVVHPLMTLFSLSLVLVIICLRKFDGYLGHRNLAMALSFSPLGLSFSYPSQAYRTFLQTRPYFFILRWQWYEWLGIFLPLGVLWWFSRLARKNRMTSLELICRALIIYGFVYFLFALVITIPPRLLALDRYQPMRSLQLLYALLFLIIGGLLGEWVLRGRWWAWMLLFAPLCAGMVWTQGEIFPSTPHIEWPGTVPANDWLQAFAWIRTNTPVTATFALNPNHMALPGEDAHGFRALAERSMLADAIKDSGAVTMFPELPLAEHLQQQLRSEDGWEHFQTSDFIRLHEQWGVTWFVLDQPGAIGLECPYQNKTLRVCHLPS